MAIELLINGAFTSFHVPCQQFLARILLAHALQKAIDGELHAHNYHYFISELVNCWIHASTPVVSSS
jgi:hypothetical protein